MHSKHCQAAKEYGTPWPSASLPKLYWIALGLTSLLLLLQLQRAGSNTAGKPPEQVPEITQAALQQRHTPILASCSQTNSRQPKRRKEHTENLCMLFSTAAAVGDPALAGGWTRW